MRKFRFKLPKKYVFTKRHKFLRLKNHPLVVPVTTFVALVIVSGIALIIMGSQNLNDGDSHIVLLTVDKKQQTVPTKASTVGELISRLRIKINKGDVVEPAEDTKIVEDEFRVNVYRAQPVTVIDGTKKTFVYSASVTPRSIASQAGIKTHPEDNLQLRIPESILHTGSIGQELVIERSVPIYLVLYGTPVGVRTHAKTVEELIKEKGVSLDPNDKVQPKLTTKIKKGMFVVVSRQGTKFTITTETVPVPKKVIEDDSLSFGTTVVRQKGSPGKTITVYELINQGGKTVRKKIQRVVVERPVPEIVARGKAVYIPKDKSSLMAAAGISSSDYAYVNFIISRESGWCPTKLQGQVGYCPGYAPSHIPEHLGYGLGQATPGSKMAGFGNDWKTSAATQLRWATSYAEGRYGSWQGAYNFWLNNTYW